VVNQRFDYVLQIYIWHTKLPWYQQAIHNDYLFWFSSQTRIKLDCAFDSFLAD